MAWCALAAQQAPSLPLLALASASARSLQFLLFSCVLASWGLILGNFRHPHSALHVRSRCIKHLLLLLNAAAAVVLLLLSLALVASAESTFAVVGTWLFSAIVVMLACLFFHVSGGLAKEIQGLIILLFALSH
jgi:hypothetical protein